MSRKITISATVQRIDKKSQRVILFTALGIAVLQWLLVRSGIVQPTTSVMPLATSIGYAAGYALLPLIAGLITYAVTKKNLNSEHTHTAKEKILHTAKRNALIVLIVVYVGSVVGNLV